MITQKLRLLLWTGLIFTLLLSLGMADSVGFLYTFRKGEVAKAAQINHNFDQIRNLIEGNLDGWNLKNSIQLGQSGESGRLGINSSYAEEKAFLGVVGSGTDTGGALATYQKGPTDRDLSVYLTPPAIGDGGLVNVYDGGGTIAVQLQPDGDVYKTGNNGFVHPHPFDPYTQIVHMSLEGGERGTYFRGTAEPVHGQAILYSPEDWQWVTHENPITVQVTPRSPCDGLYVEITSREKIVIRELMNGSSNAKFDYFVNGILNQDGTINKGLVDLIRIQNKDAILTPNPFGLEMNASF